ncbi:MAG: hypothetical protein ACYC91_17545 [Solirubrobacteraceae bacterium]
MIESQVKYVLEAMATLRRRELRFVDVKPGQQQRFNEDLQARLENRLVVGLHELVPRRERENRTLWPVVTVRFREAISEFRPEEYELANAA